MARRQNQRARRRTTTAELASDRITARPSHLRKTYSRQQVAQSRGLRETYREAMLREVAAPLKGKIAEPAYNPYPGTAPKTKVPEERKRPDRKTPLAVGSQLKVDKKRLCKDKPSTSKGNGNGRPYVPWCK